MQIFGRLQAAQGNGEVFCVGGYGRHRRQWVKVKWFGISLVFNKQNIICPLVDTDFIFSCSTQYLTGSLCSLVRYRVEHSKIEFISTGRHVISYNNVIIVLRKEML